MLVKEINEKLKDYFGRDMYNNPYYRVVWSTSQFEIRRGTYEDGYGDIYLRTVTETRRVPKYPMYPDLWVFEKIQPNIAAQYELVAAKLSYEPLWFFKDKNGNPLQPEYWACECIVQADRAVKKLQLNASDMEALQELQYAREKYLCKTIIQNESPYLAGALGNGSAVTVPSNFEGSK